MLLNVLTNVSTKRHVWFDPMEWKIRDLLRVHLSTCHTKHTPSIHVEV